MTKSYFKQIPNFEYINRTEGNADISNYITVKNLFKRGKIRSDIFGNLNYFTKYKIIGNERPDNVAFKEYNDSSLDWVILLSNNRLNIKTVNISNTSDSSTTNINLYLKNVQDGIRNTFLGWDEQGNKITQDEVTSISGDTSPDPIETIYYIIKNLAIPVGTSVVLEEDIFRDIDFKYYDLCLIASGGARADIIINFK